MHLLWSYLHTAPHLKKKKLIQSSVAERLLVELSVVLCSNALLTSEQVIVLASNTTFDTIHFKYGKQHSNYLKFWQVHCSATDISSDKQAQAARHFLSTISFWLISTWKFTIKSVI